MGPETPALQVTLKAEIIPMRTQSVPLPAPQSFRISDDQPVHHSCHIQVIPMRTQIVPFQPGLLHLHSPSGHLMTSLSITCAMFTVILNPRHCLRPSTKLSFVMVRVHFGGLPVLGTSGAGPPPHRSEPESMECGLGPSHPHPALPAQPQEHEL